MWKYLSLLCALLSLLGTGCRRAEPPATPPEAETSAVRVDTVVAAVRPGETLDAILRNFDVADREFRGLLQNVRTHFRFPIHVGEVYRAVFAHEPGKPWLKSFSLETRSGETLHSLALDESIAAFDSATDPIAYAYSERQIPVRLDTVTASGTLQGNLFDSFVGLGESPALIDAVTRIFAWDIDFFRDPRVGDSFRVLMEKRYSLGGRFLGYGQVLSARYVNAGHVFDAVLFNNRYYGADGHSLEKRLMKAPLHFTRISSGFTHSRLHPILGVRRPHWGVDYAAPMGTPILAAGDGVVQYAKWSDGYGRTVKIRHNGVYSTYYGHLQGFAKGIGAGKRVTQGQVIAYLGMSGLATGPHLDYRVEKNGAFINPVKIISEPMEGVASTDLAEFQLRRDRFFTWLENGRAQSQLASDLHSDSLKRGG